MLDLLRGAEEGIQKIIEILMDFCCLLDRGDGCGSSTGSV